MSEVELAATLEEHGPTYTVNVFEDAGLPYSAEVDYDWSANGGGHAGDCGPALPGWLELDKAGAYPGPSVLDPPDVDTSTWTGAIVSVVIAIGGLAPVSSFLCNGLGANVGTVEYLWTASDTLGLGFTMAEEAREGAFTRVRSPAGAWYVPGPGPVLPGIGIAMTHKLHFWTGNVFVSWTAASLITPGGGINPGPQPPPLLYAPPEPATEDWQLGPCALLLPDGTEPPHG
jgi:hypothetical protein